MRKWSNWIIKQKDLESRELHKLLLENNYGPHYFPVYTICEHVSQSGMTRIITAYILVKDDNGYPYPYCLAREYRVEGCGFDAGHSVAYDLYRMIFGFGGEYNERNPDSESAKSRQWWKDNGFSDEARYQSGLKHRWL